MQTQRIERPMGPLTEEEIRADERARVGRIIRADERRKVLAAVKAKVSAFAAHRVLRHLEHHDA